MASVHGAVAPDEAPPTTAKEKRVIFASSLGTIFEWQPGARAAAGESRCSTA